MAVQIVANAGIWPNAVASLSFPPMMVSKIAVKSGARGELFDRSGVLVTLPIERHISMDKDRIKGSAQQAKGALKEVAGKIVGDAKLEADGKADQVAGKIQNAVGGLKDTLRGK